MSLNHHKMARKKKHVVLWCTEHWMRIQMIQMYRGHLHRALQPFFTGVLSAAIRTTTSRSWSTSRNLSPPQRSVLRSHGLWRGIKSQNRAKTCEKNDKVRHFLGMGPLVMLHGVQMCTASAQNKKPLRQLASCCHLGVCLQESPFGWTTNSFQLRRLVSIEGAPTKWINRNTQFRTR